MATNIKCDYCSAETTVENPSAIPFNKPQNERWTKLSISVQGHNYNHIMRDICPDCVKKLKLDIGKPPETLDDVVRDIIEAAINDMMDQ